MTLSKLRPPNFFLLPSEDVSAVPSSHNISDTAATNDGNDNPLSLSSYTNKCQQQLLLAVSKSIDDGNNNDDIIMSDDHHQAENDANNAIGKNNGIDDNRKGPSMEQCILLLESHLSGFQRNCHQKEGDKLRHSSDDGEKKRKRTKTYHTNLHSNNREDNNDEDIKDEDDEVPPQLLRLARFFHYRWIPIKRALLRPVNNEQQHSTSVEVGLNYRLRLAKACKKQGLVAAAEYEMLIASLNKMLPSNYCGINDDDDDVGNGGMNRKLLQSNGIIGGEDNSLMDRVRLALLRLPTDTTITTSVASSSSSQATATAAWRHVKEMILECCRHWEENDVTISMLLPSAAAASLEEEGAERYNGLLSKLGISKVVDWALTSWTALLLSRGVDCFTATSSFTLTIGNNNINDPLSKIEIEFAGMLSNRSSYIATGNNNNDPNPLKLFATAVSNRINEILSYKHLKQLSGIHLLSLARLLATFHRRDDAEEHIMISIITCSTMKGGGMECLNPLSRLLAMYCCNISIADGALAPEDSLVGKTASRTTAADLESRLCSKLNDEKFVDRVLSSLCDEEGQATQRGMVLSRAKSFMDVIFSMSVHFIKCSCKH